MNDRYFNPGGKLDILQRAMAHALAGYFGWREHVQPDGDAKAADRLLAEGWMWHEDLMCWQRPRSKVTFELIYNTRKTE